MSNPWDEGENPADYVPPTLTEKIARDRQAAADAEQAEDALNARPLTPEELTALQEDNPKFNKAVAQQAQMLAVKHQATLIHQASINPAGPLKVTTDEDIEKRPQPAYWVEHLIPKNTVGVLAGTGGIGKTFLTLHLTRCMTTATPFFGNNVEQGTVLYVAAEGAAAFGSRTRAWNDYHGTKPAPGSITYVESGVNFQDPSSVAKLEELMLTIQPDLLVLDTWSQLSGIESENDNAGTALIMNESKRLRQLKEGSSVLWIHHVNKASGTLRGAGALRDNADFVIMAKPDGDGFKLATGLSEGGKAKDAAPVNWKGFKLESHLDSAVVTRKNARPVDTDFLELQALFNDGLAHSKAEARTHAGFAKADSGDSKYKAWDRKWQKWVGKNAEPILVAEESNWVMLPICRMANPDTLPENYPIWM